jgi:hypothetical protein
MTAVNMIYVASEQCQILFARVNEKREVMPATRGSRRARQNSALTPSWHDALAHHELFFVSYMIYVDIGYVDG